MAFLDSMKDLGNKTKEEGKRYAEIAKLSTAVSGAERQIRDLKAKIGEFVVQAGIPEGMEWPELAEKLAEVQEQYQKIDELKASIEQLKATKEESPAAPAPKQCPFCGKTVSGTAAFCMNCGKSLES